MAAVEVIQVPEFEELEQSPYLRLVSLDTTPRVLRTGPTLAQRRAARLRMIQRRRRSAIALLLVFGVALLAWPGHAIGGTTNTGLPTDLANSSVLAPGMVYVVQPGDTLNSIAIQVNPVEPALARRALVHELGSRYVVPGEHVLIP
ncbi:MAG TPA: LysM peptidoglycan-binding domain-containing protein [Acidimicrobiales bacterium]